MKPCLRCLCCATLFALNLPAADLRESLTFHANFDAGTDAVVARGDKRLYVAPSYKEQSAAQPGLTGEGVVLAPGAGRTGGALRFVQKNTRAVFYQAARNVAFNAQAWTGTISFWLSLDPDQDLEPGFCDTLQVTDKAFNDSAIWVDFTRDDKPRHFRLGVFGALSSWNPNNVDANTNPFFLSRLVVVKQPPFRRGQWTHVAITHSRLGSGTGSARLYLNGQLQGESSNIKEPFAWDPARGAIRLGVNYIGLMDDVAIFDRVLTAEEIQRLSKGGW